jgi:hypothetical protein
LYIDATILYYINTYLINIINMAISELFNFIRLGPRDSAFLNRRTGSRGEIFLDRDSQTLRIFNGSDQGGIELARSDLSNVDTSQFGIDPNIASVRFGVTILNTGDGNKYVLNGDYWPELNFVVGYTYIFNQDDPTNVYYPNPENGANNQHPLNFSDDNLNGELDGGTVYTDNVTYKLDNAVVTKQQYWDGFEAASQRSVEILVTSDTPSTLYYWCQNHLNMGKSITVAVPGSSSGGASVDVSETAPPSPDSGNLWLDTTTGKLYIYINDGDSEQWIQPAVPVFSGDYSDLSNTPTLSTVATTGDYSDLSNTPTLSTVATTGDYSDLSNTPTLVSSFTNDADYLTSTAIGNFVFSGSSVTSDDSTGITFVPTAIFQSDLTVENELFANDASITNSLQVNNVVTATISSEMSDSLSISSNNELVLSAESTILLSGLTTFVTSSEVVSSITGATGIVVHDFSGSAVFYHTSIAADFTANFTDVTTTNNRAISVALLLDQGATAYIPTAVQINGNAQTINWSGGLAPTGTANQIDIVGFTFFRVADSWTVTGSLNTYN